MSRGLSGATKTAAIQPQVSLALAAEFEFQSGPLRIWTGNGSISYGGKTFEGGGDMVAVEPVVESTALAANGLAFSLNGVPSSLVSRALADKYRGRPCRLWLWFMDSTHATVQHQVQIFAGRMDTMPISRGPQNATISLTAENRLIDLKRARTSRWTDAEQKRRLSTDRFFEYTANIAERVLNWGGQMAQVKYGTPGSGFAGDSGGSRYAPGFGGGLIGMPVERAPGPEKPPI